MIREVAHWSFDSRVRVSREGSITAAGEFLLNLSAQIGRMTGQVHPLAEYVCKWDKEIVRGSAILVLMLSSATYGQRTFEVASVHRAQPFSMADVVAGRVRIGLKLDAAIADYASMPLGALIQQAYKLKSFQVVGPAWMSEARFNIVAKIPEGAGKDDIPEMLRALLVERFKLAAHGEVRTYSIEALVVAKGGLKMAEVSPDTAWKFTPTMSPDGSMRVELVSSMAALADALQSRNGPPTVDQTALSGLYAGSFTTRPRSEYNGPFEMSMVYRDAIDQLGLKLERRKAMLETIIVDRLERAPTAN